ncbi:MAG: hypothetical protein UU93_C0001G0029 [Candidatus Amesbacteria bacterium GW2011_GWA2_42_12]|uniref:Uncharacterized protein n=1 Tax=Candidatus Amesbacteria bacterium GW2011_GWA2_42_12 TaxID=1618356 RepID=A0A0G1B6T2_9BACT|nr:MAG: hypothetical protein UU93_C0001G0029 [Candidatus Amesbacteria bacterium GW2011_GWA2_42_12]
MEIAQLLSGHQYAIRGTASLVLQGYDMGVDDIDVLCDKATAEFLKLSYSESKQFKSYFGQKIVSGIQVEFMGDWQIKNSQREWSEVLVPTSINTKFININDINIPVTTFDFELHCYALMGRWSVFYKIKKSNPSLF